jgi:hypothetical protein
MFAAALVNYVVPDPMQATMHAEDSTCMQFRALRSLFHAPCSSSNFCDDHCSALFAARYGMFEGAVVNYVVPDALQPTAHAHVSALMRFVTLFVSVKLFGFHSDTNPIHTHQECSGSEMESVWGTCMDFNTDLNPEFVCQPLFVI